MQSFLNPSLAQVNTDRPLVQPQVRLQRWPVAAQTTGRARGAF